MAGEEVSRVENMDGDTQCNALAVEMVFDNIKRRRVGLIKAFTTDFERFYQKCDPAKKNLSLYGYPSGNWNVCLPSELIPSALPEPVTGINLSRNAMPKKNWLSSIAAHSDTWLLSVAFYFGARLKFDKRERNSLFDMINDLPTLLEIVTGKEKEQVEQKPSTSKHSLNESTSKSKEKIINEEDADDNGETLCGACGENYSIDEFWICCDMCEKWFHGICVNITPARAEHIKLYKCPCCSSKKARQ